MSEWIKCSERMPDIGQQVIASGFMFGNPELGRWVETSVYGDDYEFHPTGQNEDGETVADYDADMNHTTHWQPLPPPPAD